MNPREDLGIFLELLRGNVRRSPGQCGGALKKVLKVPIDQNAIMSMVLPDPDALRSLSEKFVEAGWCERGLVYGRQFELELTPTGQSRLLRFEVMLRELGPLSDEEWATLEAVALVFAKKYADQA